MGLSVWLWDRCFLLVQIFRTNSVHELAELGAYCIDEGVKYQLMLASPDLSTHTVSPCDTRF